MELILSKSIALVVTGLLTFAFGVLPHFLMKCTTRRSNFESSLIHAILSGIVCFSGGMLLGVTFLHIIPEMREELEDLQKEGVLDDNDLPIGEIVICVGFFLVYTMDELFHMLIEKYTGHQAGRALKQKFRSRRRGRIMCACLRRRGRPRDLRTGPSAFSLDKHLRTDASKLSTVPEHSRSASEPLNRLFPSDSKLPRKDLASRSDPSFILDKAFDAGSVRSDYQSVFEENNWRDPPPLSPKFPDIHERARTPRHLSSELYPDGRSPSPRLTHDHKRSRVPSLEGNSKSESTSNDNENGGTLQKFLPVERTVTPAAHDHEHGYPEDHTHEGPTHISMSHTESGSVKGSLKVLVTIFALTFHDIFEGMTIGLQRTPMDVFFMYLSISLHKYIISFCIGINLVVEQASLFILCLYMTTFSVMTPIGTVIGMVVMRDSNPSLGTKEASAFLQGLAGGSLIYVVCFEVLQRERSDTHVAGLLKLLCVIVGYMLMLVLKVIFIHVHDESRDPQV